MQEQRSLLGPLAIETSEEIMKLSSRDKGYFWNLNTLKVNDLNFDSLNKAANR